MVNCIEWQRWTWYKGTRSRDVLSWVWSGHTVNLINMFWITSEVLGVRYFLFLSFVEAASTLMTVGPLVGAVVLWACSCQPRTALPMSANYWLRNQEAHLTAGTYRILTVSFISWNITPNAESSDLFLRWLRTHGGKCGWHLLEAPAKSPTVFSLSWSPLTSLQRRIEATRQENPSPTKHPVHFIRLHAVWPPFLLI